MNSEEVRAIEMDIQFIVFKEKHSKIMKLFEAIIMEQSKIINDTQETLLLKKRRQRRE